MFNNKSTNKWSGLRALQWTNRELLIFTENGYGFLCNFHDAKSSCWLDWPGSSPWAIPLKPLG